MCSSQPRAGAAARRRRRRRDPGPRRRVIILPARAGPGPGPRPPEPSPRPSRGRSLASLPPAPPPGPFPPPPPPPPPQRRALPLRPPAAVRGHSPALRSAAAVVTRPDKWSPERPPSSGRPRLAGTIQPPSAMTPTEAEVRRSGRTEITASCGGPRVWVGLRGEPAWLGCGDRIPRPLRTAVSERWFTGVGWRSGFPLLDVISANVTSPQTSVISPPPTHTHTPTLTAS